ncbi:discoidin domain-containing protein [Kitasatospora sp. NPDC087271]|uniref:discoidin domain-containing protein n=1 Tax=Kitasatospora sp. NPDC087271 TaxID=3364067 RepID=UPI0038070EF5
MTDGNLDTYYWSARTPEFNDWIQIDLGSQRDITKIDIYLGKPDGSFTLPDCNLESSTDGTNWTHYAPVVAYQSEYHGTTARTARYMRLRMLISRSTRIAIRSFRITTKPRGAAITPDGATFHTGKVEIVGDLVVTGNVTVLDGGKLKVNDVTSQVVTNVILGLR